MYTSHEPCYAAVDVPALVAHNCDMAPQIPVTLLPQNKVILYKNYVQSSFFAFLPKISSINDISGIARDLIWGVYALTSHCNFKTCVNVPHVNKMVTEFGGIYTHIPPIATSLNDIIYTSLCNYMTSLTLQNSRNIGLHGCITSVSSPV